MSCSKSSGTSLEYAQSSIEPPNKRRKIRKGTSSCWECKGRKKRCVLTPGSTICITCERLNLTCISQEYETITDSVTQQAEHRLKTIETLVEQLAQQRHTQLPNGGDAASKRSPPLQYAISGGLLAKCTSLSEYLKAALPLPATARLIIEYGKSPYSWVWPRTQVCPIVRMLNGNGPRALDLLPMLAQPTILARKLIELALCLLQPAFKSDGSHPSIVPGFVPRKMARTLVDAVKHVTSEDVLVKSIDGLETLLLEALYQVYLGNTELGGQIFRRALAMAQSMELDKLPPTADERAKYLWFRLVYSDRWYALGSGRPSFMKNTALSIPKTAEKMTDTRRLDGWHIVIAGRVIERNVRMQQYHLNVVDNLEEILDRKGSDSIDWDLKRAVASVLPQFWASPSSQHFQDEDAEDTTARIMAQCHQNYLILSTHQPCILLRLHRHGSNGSNDTSTQYSITASVAAARELLSRVPQFLSYPHLTSSMKGCRHKAYLAATTLLLLHLQNASTGNNNPIGHQVQQDISLTSDTMSRFVEVDKKQRESIGISCSAWTLDSLVLVVQNAYDGAIYAIHSDWCASISGERIADAQQPAFEIAYPYFGNVKGYKLDAVE